MKKKMDITNFIRTFAIAGIIAGVAITVSYFVSGFSDNNALIIGIAGSVSSVILLMASYAKRKI